METRKVCGYHAKLVEDDSVIVGRANYNMLWTMQNDLMKAEQYLNEELCIETRIGIAGDEFRPIADIVKDIKASK